MNANILSVIQRVVLVMSECGNGCVVSLLLIYIFIWGRLMLTQLGSQLDLIIENSHFATLVDTCTFPTNVKQDRLTRTCALQWNEFVP